MPLMPKMRACRCVRVLQQRVQEVGGAGCVSVQLIGEVRVCVSSLLKKTGGLRACVFWSGSGAAVVSMSRPTGGSGILRVHRESSVRVCESFRSREAACFLCPPQFPVVGFFLFFLDAADATLPIRDTKSAFYHPT